MDGRKIPIQEIGPAGIALPERPEEAVQEEDQEGEDEGQLPTPGHLDAGGQLLAHLIQGLLKVLIRRRRV